MLSQDENFGVLARLLEGLHYLGIAELSLTIVTMGLEHPLMMYEKANMNIPVP